MIRRLAETSGLVFAIVFAWKVALLLFTSQPVPNNDSFFYDGPVVNFLLHGKYCNPSLVHALPVSGGEVFSAYPPLYQAVLLGWMSMSGTSALAAMWLHVVLFGAYGLIVLGIFRRLQVPARIVNLAGLFLFGITFHDRPDTLAHVLGVLAVWGCVRGDKWLWLAMGAMVLAFCTSLQIGAVYLLVCALLLMGNAWAGRSKMPWTELAVLGTTITGFVLLVRFGYPHLWAGFQEHLRITPSLTDWRWPAGLDILKAARTAPGIFGVALCILMAVAWRGLKNAEIIHSPSACLALATTLAALAIVGASLTKISPNTVHIANYLQPLAVGAFLGSRSDFVSRIASQRSMAALFVLLALVTGIRAGGMTIWGTICARDVSYQDATSRISAAVEGLPPGSKVIASAAYLYDLAAKTNLTVIHNDWPAPPQPVPNWESEAYAKLKPARIFLTQFDYHRRFGDIVERLRQHPELQSLQVTNLARVPAPDSFPRLRRVIQHVSWAPVMIDMEWR